MATLQDAHTVLEQLKDDLPRAEMCLGALMHAQNAEAAAASGKIGNAVGEFDAAIALLREIPAAKVLLTHCEHRRNALAAPKRKWWSRIF